MAFQLPLYKTSNAGLFLGMLRAPELVFRVLSRVAAAGREVGALASKSRFLLLAILASDPTPQVESAPPLASIAPEHPKPTLFSKETLQEDLVEKLSLERELFILEKLEELAVQYPILLSPEPVLEMGKPPIRIFPYPFLKDSILPEEYYAFLLKIGSSPEDFSKMVNYRVFSFIPYKPLTAYDWAPGEALARDFADCDGFAFMACEGLSLMGKEFYPRVISQGPNTGFGHAVCLYKDQNKEWVIDQGPPYLFEGVSKVHGFLPEEEVAYTTELFRQRGRFYEWTLDPNTLEKDHQTLWVVLPIDFYQANQVLTSSILPTDWMEYRDVLLCYGTEERFRVMEEDCAAYVHFQDGRLERLALGRPYGQDFHASAKQSEENLHNP